MLFAKDRGQVSRFQFRFIALACCGILAGNAIAGRAPGIPRQQTPTPRTIILPQQVVMAQQATLAVIDTAGRLLPGVSLQISRGGTQAGFAGSTPDSETVTTDSTGRALFMAPAITGQFVARVQGTGLTASSVAIDPASAKLNPPPSGDASAVRVISYPRILAIHDRFTIAGQGFHGAADLNRVLLGDQPCLVIAASPVSLVVLPGPRVSAGPIGLRIRVDGRDAAQLHVTAVLLEFSGPEKTPSPGGNGKLILHVRGTHEPVAVEVHNSSPKVIQFLTGHLLQLKTSGGEENIAPVELKFLSSGDYTLSARLTGAESGNKTH